MVMTDPGPEVASYSASDRERWVTERDPGSARSPFARDRARVMHCSALRRLAGKTQVLVAGESDIPRTRLTHSLEVAQVSREMGAALGCDADVVDVAGLAHDLGHPPFGHNGESVLNELAGDIGGFEGNAQTFRILTRLEAKVIGPDRSAGLNLTRAALDACTKYPWHRSPDRVKFGAYPEDRQMLDWVRQDREDDSPCLEAQVMDWADDVAYSVHDVDDAVQMGYLKPELLERADQVEAVVARCRAWYLPGAGEAELVAALRRLQRLPVWVGGFDGSFTAMVSVKRMTSALIGRFCSAAEGATRARFGTQPLSRYAATLEVPEETRLEVAMMKAVAAHFVMLRPGAETVYQEQRTLIREVAEQLLVVGEKGLEPWLRGMWRAAPDDDARMRVVIDQVAGLTDSSLVQWHQALCEPGPRD